MGVQGFDLAAEWGETAIEGLFDRGFNRFLDACGEGRQIHLIVEFSQDLAETTEDFIRVYCGGGCNAGVNQTSLCGTGRVIAEAASKSHSVIVSAGGMYIVAERRISIISAGKSHIVPEASGKSLIVVVEWCIAVGGEEGLESILCACTLRPEACIEGIIPLEGVGVTEGFVGRGYRNSLPAGGNVAAGHHYGFKVGLQSTLSWASGAMGGVTCGGARALVGGGGLQGEC